SRHARARRLLAGGRDRRGWGGRDCSMSIPTLEHLAVVFTDVLEDAHARQAATTPNLLGQQIIAGIAAVRDAVLEGAAEEAEHSMIGYGASNDEGQEVADWLRSLKGSQR
ncbi:MAG: hypothetical protein M3440_14155, partial [Chloroflexota bacterium]|nr:hypothetical protein [Chloroflexota bacterium]